MGMLGGVENGPTNGGILCGEMGADSPGRAGILSGEGGAFSARIKLWESTPP